MFSRIWRLKTTFIETTFIRMTDIETMKIGNIHNHHREEGNSYGLITVDRTCGAVSRHSSYMAVQFELGLCAEWRCWASYFNRHYFSAARLYMITAIEYL